MENFGPSHSEAGKILAGPSFGVNPRGRVGSDSEAAILTRQLTKSYRNPWTLKVARGIESLDLEVGRGEVLGYLGPNGAGKTTTLKLLVGLHKATSGSAWVLGEPIERASSRRRLGFLPEQPYFYDYLSGVEYLELSGQLSGLGAQDAHRRAIHWLGRVGLGDRPQLRLRKYSKGMLQRLGLAAALVHEPELLILDEPMSGLDPFGRRDVRELILEQRDRGTTVLFSSHILPDVEVLCDRVAIILQGKLTRIATVGELVQDSRQHIEIRCAGGADLQAPPALASYLDLKQRPHETVITVGDERVLHQTLAWLIASGADVRAVTPQRSTLEELFMATAQQVGVTPSETRRSA
jgi:ABC-2 type transport system ATP-binding protein